MAILVSDTSILIDLERGGLLEHAFACGLALVVPDLLYQIELLSMNGAYLCTLGLGILTLTPDEMALAQTIRNIRPALSLPDCFALSCALRQDHVLLTGDKNLRNEATGKGVHTFGLLWLLDQMRVCGKLSNALLHEGLSKIAADPRCRLPKNEVEKRLDEWSSAAK